MLARLKAFMTRIEAGGAPAAAPKNELATTVAVLLARAATLDGSFEAEERAVVADHLCNRFAVSRDEINRTLDEAVTSADEMVDLYGLTRTVKDRLDEDGRIELMEVLWEVVYADGELHDYEAQLMRRLSGLLYVTDRESGEARKRALAKLGLEVS
ncbi:MAG: TerB family tellurite resistance protein [Thalassobaculaceae bacterium]|nr:TerB family tellurite resistance protein [Thalassobaculaceae bacterium]